MKEGRERTFVFTQRSMVLTACLAAICAAPSFARPSGESAGAQAAAPAQTAPRAIPPAPGQPPAPPAAPVNPVVQNTPPEKVVMKVGDSSVTAGQIQGVVKALPISLQRSVATQGLKLVGDQYSMLLMLSQKARAQGLDQSPEFKEKMELQRMQWLAQDEYKKLADDVQVSQDEINKYYGDHGKDFETVQVRQISVRKKPANAKPDAPGLSDADAEKRAEDIRKALMSGEDATKVADEFKMANVVFFDPNPRPRRKGQLPGEMDKVAWNLKDGEVSDIQKNPMNFYFIQVVKHEQPTAQDVSKEIENKIKEEKFQKTLDDLKQQSKIWLDPEYFAPPASAKPDAAEVPKTQAAPPKSR
jgi:peptidyl-prolyl cis-trans isomerase C